MISLRTKQIYSFQKCPFEAITIINLPSNLEKDTTHRYSQNSFKLHRLPIPRPGEVLGLVGTNGIGKSTALKILAGKQKPNLGRYSVSNIDVQPPPPCISLVTKMNPGLQLCCGKLTFRSKPSAIMLRVMSAKVIQGTDILSYNV